MGKFYSEINSTFLKIIILTTIIIGKMTAYHNPVGSFLSRIISTTYIKEVNIIGKMKSTAANADGPSKLTGIYFKVSQDERRRIEQTMKIAGIRNMSAYIRKMCIDGYILKLEIPELAECSRNLRSASNNLNQIARRVNSGGGCYPDELADLNDKLTEANRQFGKILKQLSKIKR